ncbi:MAG: transporter [Paenibacillaceae bacterium]|nr:transporter [Paenibacillaceae bacterium]
MIVFTLFYAAVYMGNAVYSTFIPIYFHSIGASPEQIGMLLSLGPLVAILAQPVWGTIGDRAKTKNSILLLLLIGSGAAILLFPLSDKFVWLLLAISLFTFFQTSIVPICDAITLDRLESERRWSFGQVRMGGTIGFAVMSVIFGVIALSHISWMFVTYAVMTILSIGLLLRFPKVEGYQSYGRKMQIWELLKHRKLVFYLAVNFVIQSTLGYYYTFFPVYYPSIGGNSVLLGWAMLISSLSEIPFLVYSRRIMKRLSLTVLLTLVGVAAMLRWALFYWVMNPYHILAVQLLHGFMFIVLTVTMATYINREVPKELKASGQTLNGLLNLGGARIIGSFFGGFASAAYGMRNVFMANAGIVALCLVALLWFAAMERRHGEGGSLLGAEG